MKLVLLLIFYMVIFSAPSELLAQIMTSNGAVFQINSGAIVTSNGGVVVSNTSNFVNQGELRVNKNSTLALPGTFSILAASSVSGNGSYWIEQDWINDASFSSGLSSVHLFGNTQQFITSSNATVTEFHDLILTGSGSAANRKKSLLNVDARISLTGQLMLNNRELETQDNVFSVLNPSNGAITNSLTLGDEGFVSADNLGYLTWNTNSINSYYFPVGSSLGTLRYRPVLLLPESNGLNTFAVRMNNVIADNYGYLLSLHDPEIETANDLFFHSIERFSGSANADIRIGYLPSADGDWSAMAHWKVDQGLWSSMGETDQASMGNYSTVEKVSWNFPDVYHPYVLTTTGEQLVIPNVFTPNQDGTNDLYFVTGKGITEFNITIVNRWGNVVFQSNDISQAWDGTSNGNACASGTYFYVIAAKSGSKEYMKQGHITLNSSL